MQLRKWKCLWLRPCLIPISVLDQFTTIIDVSILPKTIDFFSMTSRYWLAETIDWPTADRRCSPTNIVWPMRSRNWLPTNIDWPMAGQTRSSYRSVNQSRGHARDEANRPTRNRLDWTPLRPFISAGYLCKKYLFIHNKKLTVKLLRVQKGTS